MNINIEHAICKTTEILALILALALFIMPIYDFTSIMRVITAIPMGILVFAVYLLQRVINNN